MLSRIDADRTDEITGSWLSSQSARSSEGEWEIVIEGKVLRGAWASGNDRVTLFSAMNREEGVTIAQFRVPDGTNEISQVEAVPGALPIPGNEPALFTIDTAHPD